MNIDEAIAYLETYVLPNDETGEAAIRLLRAELAALDDLRKAATRYAKNLADGELEADDQIDLFHAAQAYLRKSPATGAAAS